jgi:formylglycine-generating enzyme required for sulfatase activity/serine/threonine protein kinase
MPLSVGQTLNQRYRIVTLLGQGGFGAVYKAWDQNMERWRALKENLEATPEAQRQFKREALILGDLAHPNLPRVIDHFVTPDPSGGCGSAYLVMDFVEGEDLEKMLERNGRPLPESQVIGWLSQVCDALEYLHGQQPPVIHRDIKPANIKVTPTGKAMLVDFGIAKLFHPNVKTTVGARAYTSGYSPPEQYGRGATDAQSDIYALGATAYHLLTGRLPPDSVDILSNSAAPLRPVRALNPAVSAQVSLAIERAMQLNRAKRWKSVVEFREALRPSPTASLSSGAQPRDQERKEQDAIVQPARPLPQTIPLEAAAPASVNSQRLWIGLGLSGLGLAGVVLLGMLIWGWLYLLDSGRRTPTPESSRQVLLTETVSTPAVGQVLVGSTPTTLVPNTATPTAVPVPYVTDTAILEANLTPPIRITEDTGLTMALVPAGEFQMGSESGEDDEKPVHAVYLDAYSVDLTEVTVSEYQACVTTGVCRAAFLSSANSAPDYPVTGVSWDDAQTYCKWAGGRLPTEAEWEKAARGTDGRLYPWGNDFDGLKLNFCDLNCNSEFANQYFNDGFRDMSPVGSFLNGASFYGLLDMAGNVWEWVMDWYEAGYYSNSPARNPSGPSTGKGRVIRGGAFDSARSIARTTYREYILQSQRRGDVGFRCVLQQTP